MPKIKIVAVGPLKETAYRDLADEYLKRLKPLATVEILELKDDPAGEKDPAKYWRELENKIFAKKNFDKKNTREKIVALDERGKSFDSPSFASFLNAFFTSGDTPVFLIGGSQGLGPDIPQKTSHRISFSPMTFPHRLFRVMLLEQIYRGFTILRGEPYHK